ncbi:hypothetical protein F1188_00285 [Roseospira marina]|uniref:Uncharacterized protein n=1 Tax=Roseospira marina TaxID=140057 RepID=A0A5M6IHX7_9PROT|nr:hypothetical protein [Roseospira marina]KAA5607245.1 hypothetical protein F1188_00285 [Roseospira marina]MBB4312603.1 hypothetical protein [Roseospira marina]MBB5085381.1 hypothetical protein [Roseospira marina]
MTATSKARQSTARQGKSPSGQGGGARAQNNAIRAINEQLSGPVLDVYRSLLPDLASRSYDDILASPELVNGCLLIFEKQRSLFDALLKDSDGAPVPSDEAPLWCGRSVNDVRVLVIRTTAKKYFRTHGDHATDVSEHTGKADTRVNTSLLARLFELVASLWHGESAHVSGGKGQKAKRHKRADAFYETIAPHLLYRWQVPLIPYYATLPRSLVTEMGEGLLKLSRPEDLEFLLKIGRDSFNEAQHIAGDLTREMLDTDPRAAVGVSHAGRSEYERLLEGLHQTMGARFWTVFTSPALLDSLENKSTGDIVEMAGHLDRMGPEAVDSLVEFLQRPQIAPFLRTAESNLDTKTFEDIFGIPGQPRLARQFAQKAAQLRPEGDDVAEFEKRLSFVFKAYTTAPQDFAKGL